MGLELKGERVGAGPTKLQTRALHEIAGAGGTSSVIWPEHWDAFLALIKAVLFSAQVPSTPLMSERKDRVNSFNHIRVKDDGVHIDKIEETVH